MEYVEGESLAQRLDKGSFPLEQVLRYGVQIAEALDKAHRQGIVHRDLKPANVMISKSGAKLLDFGLAKYQLQRTGPSTSSELETRDRPLTEEGVMLGTVQYMAPEQLEGKEADERTDIFAFGEILYQMATGQRPFKGNSKPQLIAAILSSEPPPISALQPLLPSSLDHLIKKCLSKDPDERWQSARDVASELKWISEQTLLGQTAPAAVRPRRLLRAVLDPQILEVQLHGLAVRRVTIGVGPIVLPLE
jgi:serine/threonine protein kinase